MKDNTTQDKTEYVRAKCIEAHSEKDWYFINSSAREVPEPARLADVLLAIQDKNISVDASGGFLSYKYEEGWEVKEFPYIWNLKEDDLTRQSGETIDFLFDILGGNA